MLIFKKVRYKNFLATGNYFVEIPLNKHKTTCIVGFNGSGKSQFSIAVSFALFGKSFRDINKPALVNSQNKKNCVVEIEFSTNNKEYKVIRGIKPNIFEIYENNVLINQDSTVKDYQDYLEKYILRMTFKSFTQIVILGSTSYVPFMELTPADRRIIIEDLLNIQIFSTMSQVLKERLFNNKTAIETTKHKIDLLKQKHEIKRNYLEEKQKNIADEIELHNKEVDIHLEKIKNLNTSNEYILSEIEELQNKITDKLNVENKYKQFIRLESQIENSISKLSKYIDFFSSNETCPTCKQTIEDSFKEEKILNINIKIEEQQNGLSELNKKLSEHKERLNKISEHQSLIQDHQIQIASNNSQINEISRFIQKLQKKIEELQSPKQIDETEIVEIEKELNSTIEYYEDLFTTKNYLDVAGLLLKENGVKSKIVGNYLPIINKLINKYLEEFDFFVNFNLNEEFKEEIRARYKDVFTYASFSDGEKMRINLSILQTWRQISRLRNSVNTNLLIIDELITDAGLDSFGTETALNFIKRLSEENNNVFVLSPRGEHIDKFDHVIRFEKVKGFSRIINN